MQRRGRDGEKEVKQQKGEERNKYLPVAFGYPRISVCPLTREKAPAHPATRVVRHQPCTVYPSSILDLLLGREGGKEFWWSWTKKHPKSRQWLHASKKSISGNWVTTLFLDPRDREDNSRLWEYSIKCSLSRHFYYLTARSRSCGRFPIRPQWVNYSSHYSLLMASHAFKGALSVVSDLDS